MTPLRVVSKLFLTLFVTILASVGLNASIQLLNIPNTAWVILGIISMFFIVVFVNISLYSIWFHEKNTKEILP